MDEIYLHLVSTGRQDLANRYLSSMNEKNLYIEEYNNLSLAIDEMNKIIKSKKSSSTMINEITAIIKGE